MSFGCVVFWRGSSFFFFFAAPSVVHFLPPLCFASFLADGEGCVVGLASINMGLHLYEHESSCVFLDGILLFCSPSPFFFSFTFFCALLSFHLPYAIYSSRARPGRRVDRTSNVEAPSPGVHQRILHIERECLVLYFVFVFAVHNSSGTRAGNGIRRTIWPQMMEQY